MTNFYCPSCGKRVPLDTLEYRCSCGGLYQLEYTPPPFHRDLIDTSQFNIFRYRRFMPLENDLWQGITLGEGMTSVIPYKKDLYLKLDYAMPTLSFKDRGAALLIWLCKTIGIKKVLQDSSGNAGNSVAAYCARAGIACEIFVPEGTSGKKIKMIESHGAKVTIFKGNRDETANACRTKAREEGIYYANHVYNPIFYQGTKTFIYEIYEQTGKLPDNLFIPVGNGTLLLGCRLAITELYQAGIINKCPKLFLVQSEYCHPLYQARGIPNEVIPRFTYAEGIAIGKPMRGIEILNRIYPGKEEIILAPEAGILPARAELARQGLFVEHTTAATYAAYQAYITTHELEGESLLPLCGAGLKSEK